MLGFKNTSLKKRLTNSCFKQSIIALIFTPYFPVMGETVHHRILSVLLFYDSLFQPHHQSDFHAFQIRSVALPWSSGLQSRWDEPDRAVLWTLCSLLWQILNHHQTRREGSIAKLFPLMEQGSILTCPSQQTSKHLESAETGGASTRASVKGICSKVSVAPHPLPGRKRNKDYLHTREFAVLN